MMVSVDGYFEGPNKEIDWHLVDDEFNEYAFDFLNQIDTLLFGRITYELMENYWTSEEAIENDPQVAQRMNDVEKVVVSRTLKNPKWKNSKLIQGDLEKEIRKIKQQTGKNIAIFGSSDLTLPLIRAGLIDEFRILINPILLGKGKSLFQGLPEAQKLKLEQTKIFKSGNVFLSYRPI
ncbi:dihydrofolate reductase [Leptospira sp. 201903070]|uniref:Dihydrofolate reductase n=2 Tax=Leptospira ainlahdjerensis TaxID=2810033 RepID=A0ABS2U667_9LEPT|nr:dihydrofolate reductase [Leptospira ainlahdjerensis]